MVGLVLVASAWFKLGLMLGLLSLLKFQRGSLSLSRLGVGIMINIEVGAWKIITVSARVQMSR